MRVDDRRHQGDKGLGEKKGWKERKTLSGFDRTTAKRLYYGNEATVSRGWCAEEQGEKFYFHFVIILLYSFFSLFSLSPSLNQRYPSFPLLL